MSSDKLAQSCDTIAKCNKIMGLIDVYVERPNAGNRLSIRTALLDLAAHEAEKQAGPVAEQAYPPGEGYNDLFNALQRIDTAAVALPGFEVRHEGGLDAVVQNIVEAIGRCAIQASAPAQPLLMPGDYALELLEAAGDVTQARVEWARAIAAQAFPAEQSQSPAVAAPPSPLAEQDKEDAELLSDIRTYSGLQAAIRAARAKKEQP